MTPPHNLQDYRKPEFIAECISLANEFAKPGTVQHFALRLGFMPHNEQDAEAILHRIILENEWYQSQGEY